MCASTGDSTELQSGRSVPLVPRLHTAGSASVAASPSSLPHFATYQIPFLKHPFMKSFLCSQTVNGSLFPTLSWLYSLAWLFRPYLSKLRLTSPHPWFLSSCVRLFATEMSSSLAPSTAPLLLFILLHTWPILNQRVQLPPLLSYSPIPLPSPSRSQLPLRHCLMASAFIPPLLL